jgi:hypothetical protein
MVAETESFMINNFSMNFQREIFSGDDLGCISDYKLMPAV